jgi:hypothetical protein
MDDVFELKLMVAMMIKKYTITAVANHLVFVELIK